MTPMHHSTRTHRTLAAALGALVGVLAVAQPALAHTGHPAGSALDGVLHPLRGLDHLLAFVAVGVVAIAARDRRIAWLTPAGFVGGMLLGGTVGLTGVTMPQTEALIALSVVVLGLAVVTGTSNAGLWLAVAAAAFGTAHGFAHGAEQPAGSTAWLYVAGFVAATAALHAAGAVLGVAIRRASIVRVAGGALVSSAGVALLLGGV